MSAEHSHALVVGGGYGGLAAAIRLRAQGHAVTLVEANDQLGGRGAVFKRDGYTFDAGPTVITAPYLIDELFELVGKKREDYVDFVPVDPFYRVKFPDGSTFDYVGEQDRIEEQIRRFNPADVEGYRRMVAMAKEIFEIGYEKLADVPFDSVMDMVRIAPQMMRLKSHRSVYGLVSKYIKDERLRQVFSFQPLLVGGNPFRVSSIYMLIHYLERKWGVFFAKGGTTKVVSALARLLDELGVEVKLNTPVTRIEVENGKAVAVHTESGERIAADLVVANADPSMVYTKLIDAKYRKKHTDKAISRKKQSMSLFVTYFGAKKQWENLAHHTIILGPRYKGLLADIFDKKVLADDFSLYLHAPTITDPDLAPLGHTGFYVLSPVPNQESGIDWEMKAADYQEKILSFLDRTHLPGLKENLTTSFSVDPRYFQNELRSTSGAAFGLEPRLTQSAYFRYHNRSEDVDGLYFVGASSHPGAGLPGVITSAKVLERAVPTPLHRLPLPHTHRKAEHAA
jgi:phytoene desaturase